MSKYIYCKDDTVDGIRGSCAGVVLIGSSRLVIERDHLLVRHSPGWARGSIPFCVITW
jgi:hypothetical protein